MPAETLHVTIIQSHLTWEDKAANLAHYTHLINGIGKPAEIVVLPEMFSTGFSMAPDRLAEDMDGDTVKWMRDTARAHRIILTGSLIIEAGGHYYNRIIWMQPDGICSTYDKRHLFGYADEDAHYTAGDSRLIVQVNGWRICPLICYDLRFPVWSRNASPPSLPASGGRNQLIAAKQLGEATRGHAPYDVLLYVANWPQRRSLAWKTLLQARAIENQSYCIGVNRVGEDGKGIAYDGESSAFDPLGEVLWQGNNREAMHTVKLSRQMLDDTRNHLPFLKDGDRFVIPE